MEKPATDDIKNVYHVRMTSLPTQHFDADEVALELRPDGGLAVTHEGRLVFACPAGRRGS